MSNEPTTAEEAGLIRVIFPGPAGRTGEVALFWSEGKAIRDYFKDPELRPYGLMALRASCRMIDQHHRRLRLTYVPRPGDTIIMQRAGKAMS